MPGNHLRANLSDLLDRVLEKGIVISADVVISVGGVPLLGLNIRAILAGMETMLQYGLLTDMDQSVRAAAAAKQPGSVRPPLLGARLPKLGGDNHP